MIRRLRLKYNDGCWDSRSGNYYFCADGLRQHAGIPLSAKVIYLCVSDRRPRHTDYWPLRRHERGVGFDSGWYIADMPMYGHTHPHMCAVDTYINRVLGMRATKGYVWFEIEQ